jgi:hypothetical protein
LSHNEVVAEAYQNASLKTANDLRTIARSINVPQLSHLSLPDIDSLTNEVARVVPAGNVPGIILSGLVRLGRRDVSPADTQKHLGMLFKGVQQVLDKAVYGTFFAGPAAILYGYQRLLQLAGKDLDSAFPEGTWQFYLEFALREDSARHTNETIGFQERLAKHGIALNEADMLTAWVLASTFFLHQLPDILANEWLERIETKLIGEVATEFGVPEAHHYLNMFSEWERLRPYQRGADAGQNDYPTYRRLIFDAFLKPYLANLPFGVQTAYQARLDELKQTYLPAYQQQMSWMAYLDPASYSETRVRYAAREACIGVIWQGRYYLLELQALYNPQSVREIILAILEEQASHPAATLDDALVTTKRGEHPALRRMLDKTTSQELESLRRTPIFINWDERDVRQSLVHIRQGKRGIGDHALTIFRTAESMVFDQSHIFFDGVWGAAVAEIMTSEALSWARYLAQLPPASPTPHKPYSPALQASPALIHKASESAIRLETGAENTSIRLGSIMTLRKLLKQRNDLAQITVNDLLLLYRSLHAHNYTPSPRLQRELDRLAQDSRRDAQNACELINNHLAHLKTENPAILIPIDASRFDPRERVFPTTFRNPLTDLFDQHVHALNTLRAYKSMSQNNRDSTFKAFREAQSTYLRLIGGIGELLSRYRQIAMTGQSTSTATIRLLGHLPTPLQKLLDTIPSKFDMLNEVLKGEEVFSNMGRVAKGSTLRRFITAKDDNEQKTLVWGVLTDNQGVLHMSLRDFRPHIAVLHSLGMNALAQQITQDYLDAYADGLNQYVAELRDIVIASRETQLEH